jgi:hypothetical protein
MANDILSREGTIGRVVVRPSNRTTIAAPNFKPRANVSIFEVNNVETVVREDGDTLIYNAVSGNYESKPLTEVAIDIRNINGGRF